LKTTIPTILICIAARLSFGGESNLTQTYQPLDGLGSGEIEIAPVMCHDWYSHSGFPTAIKLIGAKNIPPTNAPQPVGNINLAFESGITLSCSEEAPGRIVIIIGCDALHTPQGRDELQIVGATLECLRLVAGDRLNQMTIQAAVKPAGQEAIKKLIDDFIKHPKDKPFPWNGRKA
jgi:hypothetical protein